MPPCEAACRAGVSKLGSPLTHGAGCSAVSLISHRCLQLGADHPEAPRQGQEAFSLRAAAAGAGHHARPALERCPGREPQRPRCLPWDLQPR